MTMTAKKSALIHYHTLLHGTEKDGDWNIYPKFLAHEILKPLIKRHRNGLKTSNLAIHNFLSTEMNFVKIWLSLCANCSVRFVRYCGKMYSRHLFSVWWFAKPCCVFLFADFRNKQSREVLSIMNLIISSGKSMTFPLAIFRIRWQFRAKRKIQPRRLY